MFVSLGVSWNYIRTDHFPFLVFQGGIVFACSAAEVGLKCRKGDGAWSGSECSAKDLWKCVRDIEVARCHNQRLRCLWGPFLGTVMFFVIQDIDRARQ